MSANYWAHIFQPPGVGQPRVHVHASTPVYVCVHACMHACLCAWDARVCIAVKARHLPLLKLRPQHHHCIWEYQKAPESSPLCYPCMHNDRFPSLSVGTLPLSVHVVAFHSYSIHPPFPHLQGPSVRMPIPVFHSPSAFIPYAEVRQQVKPNYLYLVHTVTVVEVKFAFWHCVFCKLEVKLN